MRQDQMNQKQVEHILTHFRAWFIKPEYRFRVHFDEDTEVITVAVSPGAGYEFEVGSDDDEYRFVNIDDPTDLVIFPLEETE